MKLKQNLFVAAALIAGSASSFAAAPIACVPQATSAVEFVKTCVPEVTYFIGGSSALGGAISTILPSYFASTPVTVTDLGPNGTGPNPTNSGKPGGGVTAFYGMSNPTLTGGTSKRLFVIYNKYNGSAAGVSNVLADSKLMTITNVPESNVITVGPYTEDKGKTYKMPDCTAGASANTASCNVRGIPSKADIALTDVKANELVSLYYDAIKGGSAKVNSVIAGFKQEKLAMQGFAIAVNDKLYDAMAIAQYGSSSCGNSATNYKLDCQPNITSAQYASLITKEGSIKSAADLVGGTVDTTAKLIIGRRDQMSGTQATSNMFFAGNICNSATADLKTGKFGGALTVLRNETETGTGATASNSLTADQRALMGVNEYVQTGDLTDALRSTTSNDYMIGVIATDASDVVAATATAAAKPIIKLLKLNGSSPNFKKDGTQLTKNDLSANIIDGSYPYQVVSYAVYPTQTGDKSLITTQLLKDLSVYNSAKKLPLGFFGGTTQATTVSRVDGNNCSPLIKRAN